MDGFALRFLFGAPEALDFGTNFFVDVFDAAEATAFGAEDSLCQRKLPDLVASGGFAVVWIICFGAGALRIDLLGEFRELCKIAGPFGDERFDALVFFFFCKRGIVGFEPSVENFILEGRCTFVCNVAVFVEVARIPNFVGIVYEFVRDELVVVLTLGDFLDFCGEFADV